jgi:hypothetical protein
VTRVRATHPWHRPVAGLLSLILLELGDFAMMRRMLRGIRDRAESAAYQGVADPTDEEAL